MPKIGSELQKLFLGQIPADFADWLDFVAIGALLAFSWNSEPFVFAILAVSMGLPYLMIGPFAGALVDRTDTRTILIWSNVGRGLLTALFFFAQNWPVLMVLIALRSSVDTFFTPAKQSAIQALADKDARTQANAISHGINQASKIFAPAIGGGLLIWIDPHLVFLVNAVVSLLAASLLLRLQKLTQSVDQNDGEEEGMLDSIGRGFGLLAKNHILRITIGVMAGGYFAMFFYDTLIAPLTRELGFSQTDLGLSLAAVGAGGVLGAVVLARREEAKRPFVLIGCGAGLGAVLIASLGFAESLSFPIHLWLFLCTFFVLGIGSAIMVVPFRTIIQNNTDARSIGQVTALSEATNTFALLTAPFIGAWFAAMFSVGAAFVLGGLVLLCVATIALIFRELR